MSMIFGFVGRLMIALLFIVAGANKLADIAGTQNMIASVGLPAGLAIPAALFEIGAGLALVFGVLTRLVALLLALFCLATAFFFHNDFVDPAQATALLKNLAIAGGLLCLCGLDTMRWSYDAMREKRRREAAARDAQSRAHDAEVRAARAEGEVAGARSAPASVDTPYVVAPSGEVAADLDGDGLPDTSKRRWL
jgi:putative oxidoreductase